MMPKGTQAVCTSWHITDRPYGTCILFHSGHWKPGERHGVFKQAPGTSVEANNSLPEPYFALKTQGLDF